MTARILFTRLVERFAALRAGPPGGLSRLRRKHKALRRVRALRSEIAKDQAALFDFGHHSSSEFTALTEALSELEAGLSGVGTQAARLDAILQDKDEDRALFSAFTLYKKSVDLVHACIGIALSQEEQMEQMEGSLLQNQDGFAKNSLMFRVLVMSIRAEAARIDVENRAVFASVADEIDAMERQMNATVKVAFSELEEIVREAASGRVQLQSLQGDLHQRAGQSIKLLRTELESIKVGLAPCTAASGHIARLLEQTRLQTGDLVTSLQYQDIVRQQLEHVSQGFDDIASHLAPTASRAGIDLGYLHHAARVQQNHLGDSRAAIEKAGLQITQGSDALLKTGADLAARFAEMEKVADAVFRGSHVAQLFKQETENLIAIASQSEATNQRIARLLDRIEKSIQIFSTEIGRHELDVQLVALNSQIAAARVPDAGALNRLAEETAHLAGETASLTHTMTTQLGGTLTRLQGIRVEAEEARKTVGVERAGLSSGSLIVSEKLSRLNDRLQRTSGEVSLEFGQAYERVRELLPTLRFPSLIDSSYAPAEILCEHLLTATVAFGEADLSAEGHVRLAAHQSRYTMREERAAHAAAVGTPSVATSAVQGEAVELFDTPPDNEPLATAMPVGLDAPAKVASSTTAEVLGDGVELF